MKAIFRKLLGPVEWHGPLKPAYPHHLYFIQAGIFFYMLYRFLSRDYTTYGLLDESYFNYPREFLYELWPVQLSVFTTGHFLYWFIPRPGEWGIFVIQLGAILVCFTGLLGIFPRASALLGFLFGVHLVGFPISSNADIDGGTLGMTSLLVLSLARKDALYSLFRPLNLHKKSVDYQWPVFLFLLVISVYYLCTGLNKLIDVGLFFPIDLHLEWMAESKLRDAFFVSHRYMNLEISAFLYNNPAFSILGGFCTLVGELGMATILFLPRYRTIFILNMIIFHLLVFFSSGINFLGNCIVLFLCLNFSHFFNKPLNELDTTLS